MYVVQWNKGGGGFWVDVYVVQPRLDQSQLSNIMSIRDSLNKATCHHEWNKNINKSIVDKLLQPCHS
jgi:hypothetical protein